MTFVLSDQNNINCYGFRVLLSGGDFNRFKRNPVMLLQHDQDRVIGYWENMRLANDKSQLLADPVFDNNDPIGQETERKVNDGFLRGCSIGLRILEMQENGTEMVATKWELVEASIVAIPADAGAVRLYDNDYKRLELDAAKAFVLTFNQNKNNMPEQIEQQLQAANERMQQLEAQVQNLSQQLEQMTGLQQQVQQLQQQLAEKPQHKTTSLAATLHHGAEPGNNERTGWSFLKWAKEDPEGLALMKAERPQEYEALINA